MVQRGDGASLALEASETFRIAGHVRRQDLKRHVAAELGVSGAVHLTHPARADGGVDSIMRERSADQIKPPGSRELSAAASSLNQGRADSTPRPSGDWVRTDGARSRSVECRSACRFLKSRLSLICGECQRLSGKISCAARMNLIGRVVGRADLNRGPPAPKVNSKMLSSCLAMFFAHPASRFMRVFGGYCSQIAPNFWHEPLPWRKQG